MRTSRADPGQRGGSTAYPGSDLQKKRGPFGPLGIAFDSSLDYEQARPPLVQARLAR